MGNKINNTTTSESNSGSCKTRKLGVSTKTAREYIFTAGKDEQSIFLNRDYNKICILRTNIIKISRKAGGIQDAKL